MICSNCNGVGKVKVMRAMFTFKTKCRVCFGSGSVCRQQIRQADRRAARTMRTLVANTGRAFITANRQTRRDAYRATRRRNDGRLKKLVGQTKVRYR